MPVPHYFVYVVLLIVQVNQVLLVMFVQAKPALLFVLMEQLNMEKHATMAVVVHVQRVYVVASIILLIMVLELLVNLMKCLKIITEYVKTHKILMIVY